MPTRVPPQILAVTSSLLITILLWHTFAVGLWAPIVDVDLWWQLWAGTEMLAGRFPRHNVLGWTAPEHRWVSHEPLVALIYGAVGLDGVGLVRAVLVTLCAGLAAHLGYRRGNAYASIVAIAWASQLVVFGITERALTFGNLMMAATMAVLFVGRGTWTDSVPAVGDRLPKWRPAVACLLVALWANVHGSFVLGIAAIALVSWRWGLIAVAATLLNPNGIRLWWLVMGYGLGSDAQRVIHENVIEWRPLWTTPGNIWRLVVLLLGLALVVKRGTWRQRLLVLGVTGLALRHARYTDLAALACLPFLAQQLERSLPARPLFHPAWLCFPVFVISFFTSPKITVHAASFPPGLEGAIPGPARVFNTFDVGGYLGYRGVPVFFDSRNDCYPASVLEDGFTVDRLRPGWEQVIDRWQIDVVVTRDQRLVHALLARGWVNSRQFAGDQNRKGLSVVTR